MNIGLLRSDIERWGIWRSLFIRVMAQLKKYLRLRICRVLERRMTERPGPALAGDITVRALSEDDLLSAAADPELDMSHEFVRAALVRGDIAFGAFDGERLVSYTWRAFGITPDIEGVNVRFDRPRHYGYKAFTRPSYRGRHILRAIARCSDFAFLERGFVAQLMFIDVENFSSLKAQAAMGTTNIGFAGYLKQFGVFLSFRTPAVKATGFRFIQG